jgi:hypothetical protein
MNRERYELLMQSDTEPLTDEECKQGWHFCICWDGLLVGPGMMEEQFCDCDEIELHGRALEIIAKKLGEKMELSETFHFAGQVLKELYDNGIVLAAAEEEEKQ